MISDIDFYKEVETGARAMLPYLAPQEVERIAAVLASGTEAALAKIQSQPGMNHEQKRNEFLAAVSKELNDLSRDLGVRNLGMTFDLDGFVKRIISRT